METLAILYHASLALADWLGAHAWLLVAFALVILYTWLRKAWNKIQDEWSSIRAQMAGLHSSIASKNGHSRHLPEMLEEQTARLAGELAKLTELLITSYSDQQRWIKEPWRLCEQFTDCPAVRDKAEKITSLEQQIGEHELREENLIAAEFAKMESLLTISAQKAADDRKQILDLILENRKVVTSFTEHLGNQLIRAITRSGDGEIARIREP